MCKRSRSYEESCEIYHSYLYRFIITEDGLIKDRKVYECNLNIVIKKICVNILHGSYAQIYAIEH